MSSFKAENLITTVKTMKLLDVDIHPNSSTLMEHKGILVYMVWHIYAYKEENVPFLNAIEISLLPASREGPFHVMCVRTPMKILESRCYENNVCTRRLKHLFIHEDDHIGHEQFFLSVSSSLSPSVVTMPTSRPAGICRVNNLNQEPILEDYDCPILEDYFCKEREQYDFELESEDDGWPGIENHWCPLLDLSYHYFIGRSQVGIMEDVDLTSFSSTCQFAIFNASLERETATKHVWTDRVCRSWLDEWCYVPPFPTLQRQ